MKTLRFAFLVMVLSFPVIGVAQNPVVSDLGSVRGTVTRAGNGEPLSGATITLQGGNADPQAIQASLNGAAAQGVVVTPPPGASTMDIVQAMSNAAQALGRPQLTVAAIQSQLASLSGRTAPTATSDREGHFTFANVTPGPYTVRVQKAVTATGGRIPPAIRVQLMPDEGSAAKIPAYQQVSRRTATVSAEGSFSVPAVPEGRFRISAVAGLPQDMYIADVRQNAISAFDSGFDVNARNINAVEIVLGAGAGAVNGVVRDGPSKVVPGATVVLVPEAKRRNNHALYVSANSDATGRFNLRGVAPGDYKVFAWESIPAFAHVNAAFMAKHEESGRLVHVGQNGTVSVELSIIPAVPK